MVHRLLLLSLFTVMLVLTTLAMQNPSDSSRTLKPYLAALNVRDASRTAEWYVRNLGFKTTRTMDFPQYDSLRIIFLKRDAFELELIQKKASFDIRKYVPDYDNEKAPVQGFTKVAFMVRGVKQLVDSLRQNGVKILYGPFDDEPFGIRTVIIEDSDGNLLQFSEPLETMNIGK
jgi:catechol 2,3-dioxygenase-like lactoylglutathione lyase family enzyme